MLNFSNTPKVNNFDKLLKFSNIHSMLESSDNTVGGIAVEYLLTAMKLQDVRQYELAQRLGISRQTLANRLHNHSMDINDFIELAFALDVNPADVIDQAVRAKGMV